MITLPRPVLAINAGRAVCFGYSAKAAGLQGSDGGYRKLLIDFSATGLVAGDSYTLVPQRQYKSRWIPIGAGISYGFKANARTRVAHGAPVTSVYAEDALSIPHDGFAARFTLTNFGKGNDTTLLNAGKLKAGVSNEVTVTIAPSPVRTCPRKVP